jgi:prepilin-type N-terminal cleavage/methylation domain-containing protein
MPGRQWLRRPPGQRRFDAVADCGQARPGLRIERRPTLRGSTADHAFTLVEILVVIVVIAIASALLLPDLSSITDRGAEDRALRLVAGSVHRAQDLALLRHEPQSIAFDLDRGSVTVSGEPKPVSWPGRARVSIVSAGSSVPVSSGVVRIEVDRFGNLAPFEVRIGRAVRVTANPFTGLMEPSE